MSNALPKYMRTLSNLRKYNLPFIHLQNTSLSAPTSVPRGKKTVKRRKKNPGKNNKSWDDGWQQYHMG